MNVEIGTEAVRFPEKEFINGIFVAVQKKGNFRSIKQKRHFLLFTCSFFFPKGATPIYLFFHYYLHLYHTLASPVFEK